MNRSVRILAGAEVAISLLAGLILLIDAFGEIGPDSIFTGMLALLLPLVVVGIVISFPILVTMAIKDWMRKKERRSVGQLAVIGIAMFLLVALINWLLQMLLRR